MPHEYNLESTVTLCCFALVVLFIAVFILLYVYCLSYEYHMNKVHTGVYDNKLI